MNVNAVRRFIFSSSKTAIFRGCVSVAHENVVSDAVVESLPGVNGNCPPLSEKLDDVGTNQSLVCSLKSNRHLKFSDQMVCEADQSDDFNDRLLPETSESRQAGNFEPAKRFSRRAMIRHKTPNVSFTLSPLIEKSRTLRRLVDFGVDLWALEEIPHVGNILIGCEWERDVIPRLLFLSRIAGLDRNGLAKYLTGNPWILQQNMDDLQTRVNYLESKKFSTAAIARIVTSARYWLNIGTEILDQRLGWIKNEFHLTGDELRFVVTKNPKIVTLGTGHVQFLLFSFEEEMGFNSTEIKSLLLGDPILFTSYKQVVHQTFNFLHNTLKFSHENLLKFPRVLRCYASDVKARHEFLKSRKLDQYNSEKPNYISLHEMCGGSDREFCEKVAKCSLNEFNRFLKRR